MYILSQIVDIIQFFCSLNMEVLVSFFISGNEFAAATNSFELVTQKLIKNVRFK